MVPALPGAGQTAYFSITGDLAAADADQSFGVNFTRNIVAADDPRFTTFHRAGGTNAAGQVIAAGSFDPLLNLSDTFSGIVDITNDDGGDGQDALLAYPGVADSGNDFGTLTLPNQVHTLELRKFTAGATGPYAVDILGPADAVELWTPQAATNSSITDVIFGTTGAGSDPAHLRLNSTSATTITGQLSVAHTGQALLTQSGSGSVTVQGLTVIYIGGTANLNNGTFNANGGILVDGGSFTNSVANSSLVLGAGQDIIVRNNGQFTHTPGTSINNGSTFAVESGGDATFNGFFGLGTSGDGTLRVTGDDSTFHIDSAFNTFWGQSGNTATVEVTDSGSATIDFAGGIDFARSTSAATAGIITVNSGGDLTFANTRLTLSEDNSASTTTVNLDGTGSTITHTGSQPLIIGGDGTATGNATINVTNNAVYTTSTGLTTVAKTGTVTASTGGQFNVKGDLTIDGGSVDLGDNVQQDPFVPTATINVTNAGQLQTARSSGPTVLRNSQIANVTADADWTHTGNLIVAAVNSAGTLNVDGNGSSLDVTGVFELSVQGGTGIVNVTNNAGLTVNSQLDLARSVTNATTNSTLNINSGGDVAAASLQVGDFDGNQGTGTINLDGSGSSLTISGNATIGNADTSGNGGVHTLNITDGGTFTTGTGITTVRKTGTLNLDTPAPSPPTPGSYSTATWWSRPAGC